MCILNEIKDTISANLAGFQVGLFSVCSADPVVLKTSIRQAKDHSTSLIIESTANQVNQEGGYTGQTPTIFKANVYKFADEIGLCRSKIILGGDHLGPTAWQNATASIAMAKARTLVREYVLAGFSKIHLDASMALQDDAELSVEVIAQRTAELCQVAEHTWESSTGFGEPPLYVIGSEVPAPGGASELPSESEITRPESVLETIECTHRAFIERGLERAWERVIAIVVHPGLEFTDEKIRNYDQRLTTGLSSFAKNHGSIVFEAHSTDFQSNNSLSALVRDHFCLLKVGPWLSFVRRETLYALEMIERELVPEGDRSNLRATVLREMMGNSKFWRNHISVDRIELGQFGLTDRSRYYFQLETIQQSIGRLLRNLTGLEIPLGLISQFLPDLRENCLADNSLTPQQLIFLRISRVLQRYQRACGQLPH